MPPSKLDTVLAARKAQVDLARAPNLLASGAVDERKRTISALIAAELSPEQLKPLLRPLLLRFADESERCRDGAIALFSRWERGAEASEVSGALPFLMPVMVERLGSEAVTESSEEVRAALVCLMRDVLTKCRALLRPYLREVGAIALGCARDSHPEVIKGLCRLLSTVAEEVLLPMCKGPEGGKPVKPFSQKLLDSILPHIRHRHAAVRLEVLGAIEGLLLCGAGQSVETLTGWRLKNNVPIAEFYGKGAPRLNYLADLSRDRSVPVRRKLITCVSRWMSEMAGEDLYEQEVRIVAYLVSGLNDDDRDTADLARKEIERLGDEHLETHAADYKERIEYGWADEAEATAAITLPAPPPFIARPPLGARERIGQHFRALIHPICAELDLWTSTERVQSAKLLEVLLVYVEQKVTEFAHQLLPVLAKGMDSDDNPELPPLVARCAAQFSQHCGDPDEYMPLLVSGMSADALNTMTQRVQHVRLLTPILAGMRPLYAARTLHKEVAPLLADESLVASHHTALRLAVRSLIATALPATIQAAEEPLARAAEAGQPPLAPALLFGVLIFCCSDLALQPLPEEAVVIADGLEEITTPAKDGAAWEKVAAEATALAAALMKPLARVPGELDERNAPRSVWLQHRAELSARLEAAIAEHAEHAERALELLERLAPYAEAAAIARQQQSRAGAVGAPSADAAPRRAVAIAECDGFSDDDDADEAHSAKTEPPLANATASERVVTVSDANEYDDFADELD